jgi:hypothetical protein
MRGQDNARPGFQAAVNGRDDRAHSGVVDDHVIGQRDIEIGPQENALASQVKLDHAQLHPGRPDTRLNPFMPLRLFTASLSLMRPVTKPRPVTHQESKDSALPAKSPGSRKR